MIGFFIFTPDRNVGGFFCNYKYYPYLCIMKNEMIITQRIYWAEDNNGNIIYDIESIREEFEQKLAELEQENENSEFEWNND
jgi:hypothetical protein